jgi:hypothetical protein
MPSNHDDNQAIFKMRQSLKDIEAINEKLNLLSLNALIQAADAGDAGKAFAVVAQQMQELSNKTAESANRMSTDIEETANEVINNELNAKGARFSDMAHNTIELIDRNLYERTADVRWWATDSDLVLACANPDDKILKDKAAERMSVILRNYTVYDDILLISSDGVVIANGAKKKYESIGQEVSSEPWFTGALQTRNGKEYYVEDVHQSYLIDGKPTAAYSTAVREDGNTNGKTLGVLVVLFDWQQGLDIVKNVAFDRSDRDRVRTVYFNNRGIVIAASDDRGILKENMSECSSIQMALQGKKGYRRETINDEDFMISFASSPGYETYEGLGWGCAIFYSVI